MSPTLIREAGYRIVLYYNDHVPAHVHVKRAGDEARVQLASVKLMDNWGYNPGKVKMVKQMNEQPYANSRPITVTITGDKVIVTLADGREISNPLAWFPWLAGATPQQQAHYELWPFSIDWSDLDNGLGIEGMLRGIRPRMPEMAK